MLNVTCAKNTVIEERNSSITER